MKREIKRGMNIFFNKKAQVSAFVIIAIIVVIAIAGYFVWQNNFNKTGFDNPDDQAKLNIIFNSIENCKAISSDDAVFKIGRQGGYNKHPETYLDFGWTFIPYYFIEGEIIFPDKSNIEKDLGVIFDNVFVNCISLIDTKGFKLKIIPASSVVQILPGSVKFNINDEFVLEKNQKSTKYDLKNEPYNRNYKLNEMLDIAKYISDSHKANPPLLCMSCLVDMAKQKELLVDFVNLGDTSRLIVITDLNRTSEEFIYQFIEKYKGGETQLSKINIPNA